MSDEAQDHKQQDGGHDGVPAAKLFFWRRLLVALTSAMILGLLARFLTQILGQPGNAFFSFPSAMASVVIVLYCEPRTMRHLGLMIVVAVITGTLVMLVYAPFMAHSESFLGLGLGTGLATAFAVLIAYLARWYLDRMS